jgi:hypothetical protein
MFNDHDDLPDPGSTTDIWIAIDAHGCMAASQDGPEYAKRALAKVDGIYGFGDADDCRVFALTVTLPPAAQFGTVPDGFQAYLDIPSQVAKPKAGEELTVTT